MPKSLEITFHQIEASPAIEAAIREQFAKLAKRYDRLTACRVTVEALHRQHRTGNLYDVHIDMLVPGAELVVSRQPQKAKQRHANPDVYTSIRDAFAAAERKLKRFKRQMREDLQPDAPLSDGRVAEMHVEDDWGYLRTKGGALLYFNRSAVLDGSFDNLAPSDAVIYQEAAGESGPTAVKVWSRPGRDPGPE
jgi:ribosome-associated translation inhibitor RaiA